MACVLASIAFSSQSVRAQGLGSGQPRAAGAAGNAPVASVLAGGGGAGVRFTENRGQVVDTRGAARPDILYTASSAGMRLFLRRDGISYVFTRWVPDSSSRPASDPAIARGHDGPPPGHLDLYRMDMQLIGANPRAEVVSEERTDDLTNYYLTQCPDGITHVRSYHRLAYREIYPHIDLVFYSDTSGMKYDFVVHPGGRVADIAWQYIGSDGAAISAGGSVRAATALGNIEEAAPVAYQGNRHGVDCRYIDNGGRFSYAVAPYDKSETLVIDPALQWATYCGGNATELNGLGIGAITANATGNIAIVGVTESTNLPVTAGVTQAVYNDGYDLYMLELGPAGNLIWCTYWGGPGLEESSSIAFDGLGNCAVAGWTFGPGFPIGPNPQQAANAGMHEIIVGDFDATGVRRWSTFLGGAQNDGWGGSLSSDQSVSVAADQQGNVVVASETFGTDFPTRTPWQAALRGSSDATITKFSPAGALLWSSYFGGAGDDECTGVAVDAAGDILACGLTTSANLPIFGTPFQPTRHGYKDGFILKVNSNGVPQWSTYYGVADPENEDVKAIAVDASGAVAITGEAGAGLLTTPASFQSAPNAQGDCFVAKFDGNGNHLWSTYYGGSQADQAYGIAFGGSGDILFSGFTASTDFPVTPGAYQAQLRGTNYNAFLVQLAAGGAQTWATYYGGTGLDLGTGVAYGGGGAYIVGITTSTNLTGTAGGFEPNYRGGGADNFIAKFGLCVLGAPSINASGPLVLCDGDSITITAPPGYSTYQWAPNGETSSRIVVKRTGSYSVTTTDAGGCVNTSQTIAVRVNKKPVPVITPAGTITLCPGDSVKLSARQKGFTAYKWSNNDTLDTIWVKAAGTYTVQVTDTNGCTGQSVPVMVRMNPAPSRPVLAPTDTIRVCTDSLLRLDAGGGYASYLWSPGGETGRTIQARVPGVYYVSVTNAGGCRARSDTVVVLAYPSVPARLIVTGSTEFCSDDSLLLQTPFGFTSPRWSNGATGSRLVVRASGLYYATAIDSNGCRERTDSVRVTVHPSPKADITGPARVCTNASTTYGTAAGTTLLYEWTITGDGTIQGASDGPGISVQWGASGGGTVTLRVTDTSHGCVTMSRRDVTIGTSLTPVITPSGTIRLCAGDSVELDAGAGYTSYTWSNGATSRTIWVKDSARYAVAVVDPSGCRGTSDTVRVRIEAPPEPVITGPVKVCFTSSGSYTVPVLVDAIYKWSVNGGTITSGDSTPAITVQWGGGPVGTVDVTVISAGGCVGVASRVTVEIGSSLTPVITTLGPATFCAGDSVELDAGAGYTSYAWSNGATSRTIWVKDSAGYAVTVVAPSGCSGMSDTVHARIEAPPAPVITGPLSVCRTGGGSYFVAALPGASYKWSVSGGTIASGDGTPVIAVQWGSGSAGTVDVTVTSAGGCVGAASQVTIDIGNSVKPVITPGGNPVLCAGDSIELDAGAGYASYVWSTGAASERIVVRTAGSYAVTVSDGSGCGGTSDSVRVTLHQPPVVAIVPAGPITLKSGDSIVLDAGSGYTSYRWRRGSTQIGSLQHLTALDSGDYTVIITDSNGCTAAAAVRIDREGSPGTTGMVVLALDTVSAAPGENVAMRLRLISSANLAATGASSYEARVRYHASLLIPSGATLPGIMDDSDRVLTVTGNLPPGITSGDLQRIAFIAVLGDDSIATMKLESVTWRSITGGEVSIASTLYNGEFYLTGLCTNGGTRLVRSGSAEGLKAVIPNPANSVVRIEYDLEEDGPCRLAIVDLLGREAGVVFAGDRRHGAYAESYDVRNLASGLYRIVLETATGRMSVVMEVTR